MTDIKKLIEKLKELEAKASPGPWFDGYALYPENITPDDAKLIKAMRNALPALIQIFQRLEDRAKKAEAEREWLLDNMDFPERDDYCSDGMDCPFDDEPEGGCEACRRNRFRKSMERGVNND